MRQYGSPFVSVKIRDLLIVFAFIGGATLLSFALPFGLYLLIRLVGDRNMMWRFIGAPLISFSLHALMHLYRVGVEQTSQQRMAGTLSSMPVYKGRHPKDGGIAPQYGLIEYDKLLRGSEIAAEAETELDTRDASTQDDSENTIADASTSHPRSPSNESQVINLGSNVVSPTAEGTDEMSMETFSGSDERVVESDEEISTDEDRETYGNRQQESNHRGYLGLLFW